MCAKYDYKAICLINIQAHDTLLKAFNVRFKIQSVLLELCLNIFWMLDRNAKIRKKIRVSLCELLI